MTAAPIYRVTFDDLSGHYRTYWDFQARARADEKHAELIGAECPCRLLLVEGDDPYRRAVTVLARHTWNDDAELIDVTTTAKG